MTTDWLKSPKERQIDLAELIGVYLEETAVWHDQADHDCDRREKAAEILFHLSEDIARFEGSALHQALLPFIFDEDKTEDERRGMEFIMQRSALIRKVGLTYFPKDAEELLTDLRDLIMGLDRIKDT